MPIGTNKTVMGRSKMRMLVRVYLLSGIIALLNELLLLPQLLLQVKDLNLAFVRQVPYE